MPTILKNITARVVAKAEPEGQPDTGTFDAVVSVFGNVDTYGDVVDKGAFTDTLKAWAAAGQPIPVIWSHDWEDPFSHIGEVDAKDVTETDEGLTLTGARLDLSNPTAAQVYKLMKAGRVTQFSFAATTPDEPGAWSLTEGEDGRVVQHLSKLDLIEVGPCLRGVNSATRLVSVKSMRRPPVRKAEGDADPDDSVQGLATAIDAAVDQALALVADTDLTGLPDEVQQAFGLLGAADTACDQLLAVLGVPDPDDAPDGDDVGTKALRARSLLAKAGKVLAQKHVDTLKAATSDLKKVHGVLDELLDTVSQTAPANGGGNTDPEPEGKGKASSPGSAPNTNAKAAAKARLAELAKKGVSL